MHWGHMLWRCAITPHPGQESPSRFPVHSSPVHLLPLQLETLPPRWRLKYSHLPIVSAAKRRKSGVDERPCTDWPC